MSALGAYLLQAALTLGVVGLLAAALVYLLRRGGFAGANGPVQLYGRLPLDARRAIYLVKVGERVLVLGASEAGLRLLTTLPAAELPKLETEPSSLTARFGKLLAPSATHNDAESPAPRAAGEGERSP